MGFVKSWWPIPAIVGVVVAVQVWWTAHFNLPGGHASDHFSSATAIFGFSVASAVIVWAVPAQERRNPVLWILAALVVAAALAVTVANVRIVNAIGPHNWSDEQADLLGPSKPGFTEGHRMADQANLAIFGTAVLLCGWMAWRRMVPVVVAVIAAFVSFIGGVGVFLLAIAAVVERARAQRARRTRELLVEPTEAPSDRWGSDLGLPR